MTTAVATSVSSKVFLWRMTLGGVESEMEAVSGKSFNTGAYSLPIWLQGIPTHGIWPIIKTFSLLYLIQLNKLCQPAVMNDVCSPQYRTIAFLVKPLERAGIYPFQFPPAGQSSMSAGWILLLIAPPLEQILLFSWPLGHPDTYSSSNWFCWPQFWNNISLRYRKVTLVIKKANPQWE